MSLELSEIKSDVTYTLSGLTSEELGALLQLAGLASAQGHLTRIYSTLIGVQAAMLGRQHLDDLHASVRVPESEDIYHKGPVTLLQWRSLPH
jgi:hypothetical protein